jgi:hypothetical protein
MDHWRHTQQQQQQEEEGEEGRQGAGGSSGSRRSGRSACRWVWGGGCNRASVGLEGVMAVPCVACACVRSLRLLGSKREQAMLLLTSTRGQGILLFVSDALLCAAKGADPSLLPTHTLPSYPRAGCLWPRDTLVVTLPRADPGVTR